VSDLQEIRQALQELPVLSATSSGNPPEPSDVFFPASHAMVLDPDVSLVIGNRGMGKTFWTLALADPEVRPLLYERYVYLRKTQIANLEVNIGFGDAEGAVGEMSRAVLESLPTDIPAELIWRSLLIRILAPNINYTIPTDFAQLVEWVAKNPEQQLNIFRASDTFFVNTGRNLLILFDQLDQLATDWSRIQFLTQGLIKIALAMKSYRAIKIKIFMRTDQAENKELFRFPDGSKISGSSKILKWRASDLFGLLFFEIMKSDIGKRALTKLGKTLDINFDFVDFRTQLPVVLSTESTKQADLFHALAGPYMGRNEKRGRPYTWLPAHLADGRGEISPRVFLDVMRVAAQSDHLSSLETAIDYRGILEGVRHASSGRLAELEEDYPWVSDVLQPLKGLLVPCERRDIVDRWDDNSTTQQILERYSGSRAPIEISASHSPSSEGSVRLIGVLNEIGVFEERLNGKINVPDIFRVNAGILRKGGIPPQERKRL
jgi:hypothetical protein